MVERTNYGKLVEVIEPPNLIEIQTVSYKDFLQLNVIPGSRKNMGLQAVFKEVFPIESYDGRYALDFVKYEFSLPNNRESFGNCVFNAILYQRIAVSYAFLCKK